MSGCASMVSSMALLMAPGTSVFTWRGQRQGQGQGLSGLSQPQLLLQGQRGASLPARSQRTWMLCLPQAAASDLASARTPPLEQA